MSAFDALKTTAIGKWTVFEPSEEILKIMGKVVEKNKKGENKQNKKLNK